MHTRISFDDVHFLAIHVSSRFFCKPPYLCGLSEAVQQPVGLFHRAHAAWTPFLESPYSPNGLQRAPLWPAQTLVRGHMTRLTKEPVDGAWVTVEELGEGRDTHDLVGLVVG